MLGLIKKALAKVDDAASYLADLVVSEPESTPENTDAENIKFTAGATTGCYAATGILSAAISGTELLSAAGASASVVQASATIAAAAAEISTITTGASSTLSAATTVASSASAPLVAASACVLFVSYTASKIGYRAAGHAYNNIIGQDTNLELTKELGLDHPNKELLKPRLTT
ncbi:MAG: hypothetical protein HOI53_10140 [Francisellaceae bacterium]|jgi:hypothetical protein|nr:hypothetical protein [Francisellaceae bacterium]MBT6208375.1 hypothetical protein [Francisellaceae bacterium]MBT6538312.1 hypothetical protein [Francisellaceae bacterium]